MRLQLWLGTSALYPCSDLLQVGFRLGSWHKLYSASSSSCWSMVYRMHEGCKRYCLDLYRVNTRRVHVLTRYRQRSRTPLKRCVSFIVRPTLVPLIGQTCKKHHLTFIAGLHEPEGRRQPVAISEVSGHLLVDFWLAVHQQQVLTQGSDRLHGRESFAAQSHCRHCMEYSHVILKAFLGCSPSFGSLADAKRDREP